MQGTLQRPRCDTLDGRCNVDIQLHQTRPDAGLTLQHKQMIGTNHCIEHHDAVFILGINGKTILEIN